MLVSVITNSWSRQNIGLVEGVKALNWPLFLKRLSNVSSIDLSSDNQIKSSRPQVTFYTKAGCHLCEDARDMLDEIAADKEYDLHEIDIRSDLALFELYRYRIPVIIIDETHVLEGRIEYSDLIEAFE